MPRFAQKLLWILFRFLIQVVGLSIFVILLIWLYSLLPVFKMLDSKASQFYRPDPELAFTHIPNSKIQYTDKWGATEEASINSLGFRGPEIQNPKNKRRIVIIGDSVVYGQTVRDEETIASQLQNQLEKQNQPVEVINAGIKGYSMDQEFQLLRKKVIPLNPDQVIWMLSLDDFAQINLAAQVLFDYDSEKDKLIERNVSESTFYKSSEFLIRNKQPWNERFLRLIFYISNQVAGLKEQPKRKQQLEPKFKKIISEAAELAKQNNFDLKFYILPNKAEVSMARAEQISPVQMINLQNDQSLRKIWNEAFQTDGNHFTKEGAEKIAELLASSLHHNTK